MNAIIEDANKMELFVTKWNQFHKCQAYTSNPHNGKILIKSYDTIVGCVDIWDGVVYEFGKYSMTTSKQFARICAELFAGFKRELIKETNWKNSRAYYFG